MTTFIATPIPLHIVEDARARLAAGDVRVARVIADAKPSYPCRVCLKDADIGEPKLLFSYRPFDEEGPYAESGAVLAHERSCEPAHLAPGEVPEVTTVRTHCVVRTYDSRGWIHDGVLTETRDAAAVIIASFEDPDVAYAHVRNVGYGCFAYAVKRVPAD